MDSFAELTAPYAEALLEMDTKRLLTALVTTEKGQSSSAFLKSC
jgi:hypothetical protein